MSEQNRERVASYYRRLWSGDGEAATAAQLTPDYVEHQYSANFTRAGLLEYIAGHRREHAGHGIEIHYALSEGDFVFLLVQERLSPGVDYARAELFRLVGDRIAEHWGSQVLDDKNRKNPNDTWRGSKVNREVDYAQRFCGQFEQWDRRGFDGQELETFEISRVPEYQQHSPKGGDGRHGLVEILSKAKAAGIKTTMTRYRSLCDGDFLMSHRLYDTKPTHPLMNRIYTFDVFRIDSQGRAVEHWDVMDPVPTADLLARMI